MWNIEFPETKLIRAPNWICQSERLDELVSLLYSFLKFIKFVADRLTYLVAKLHSFSASGLMVKNSDITGLTDMMFVLFSLQKNYINICLV